MDIQTLRPSYQSIPDKRILGRGVYLISLINYAN